MLQPPTCTYTRTHAHTHAHRHACTGYKPSGMKRSAPCGDRHTTLPIESSYAAREPERRRTHAPTHTTPHFSFSPSTMRAALQPVARRALGARRSSTLAHFMMDRAKQTVTQSVLIPVVDHEDWLLTRLVLGGAGVGAGAFAQAANRDGVAPSVSVPQRRLRSARLAAASITRAHMPRPVPLLCHGAVARVRRVLRRPQSGHYGLWRVP